VFYTGKKFNFEAIIIDNAYGIRRADRRLFQWEAASNIICSSSSSSSDSGVRRRPCSAITVSRHNSAPV